MTLMLRRYSLSTIVIALAAVAIAGSGLTGWLVQRRVTQNVIRTGADESQLAATATAANISFAMRQIRAMLAATAVLPELTAAEPAADVCAFALRHVRQSGAPDRLLSRVALVTGLGAPICASPEPAPNGRAVQLAARRALLSTAVNVSTPAPNPQGRWTVWLSVNVAATNRQLAAEIDLARLNEIIFSDLPVDVLLTVADGYGTTLLRSTGFEQRAGRRVPFQDFVVDLESRLTGEPVELLPDGNIRALQRTPVISPDSEGRDRVWVSHLVPDLPWVVYAGALRDNVADKLGAAPWLVGLGPMTAGALAFAVVGVLAFVARDAARLVAGVQRAAHTAGAEVPVGGTKEMAMMADAVRVAFEERARAEAALSSAKHDLERRVDERSRELEVKARDLEAANLRLVEALRVKDSFLAVMSHELRTPLSSMLGITEAALEGIYGDLTPRQREVLALSLESGRHLLELVNDVLDYSKLRADAGLNMQAAEVADIVHASVATVQPLAASRGVRLDTATAGGVVVADARRLKQVLINLLGNAVKFTAAAGVVTITTAADGNDLLFTVGDTGRGIPEADQERIFRPFEQLQTGLDRAHEGTGLGLALSRTIVEQHGGRIEVVSEVGKGSTFTVRIPRMPPPGSGPLPAHTA